MSARMIDFARIWLLPLTIVWLSMNMGVVCQSDPLKSMVEKVKSKNEEERLRGKQELLDIRKKVIDEMISIVKSDPTNVVLRNQDPLEHSSKLIAIEILAEMKADEGVDVLLDNIFFAQDPFTSETLFEELSPAGKALVKVGKPTFDRIWTKFGAIEVDNVIVFKFAKEDENGRKLENRLRAHFLPSTLFRVFREIMGHEGLREFLKRKLDDQESRNNKVLLKNLKLFARMASLPEEYWKEDK